MGEPKALLDWGGQPLIAYQVQQLKEAGVDEVIVVVGHHGDEIHRRIGQLPCRVMFNARYVQGRASSLRIGARAVNRDAEAIVIMNVDQPRPASHIRALLAAHTATFAATRPHYNGHSGHPLVVSGALREELLHAVEEEGGLRAIIRAHAAEIQDIPSDALCQVDVNTPEEYRAALASVGTGG